MNKHIFKAMLCAALAVPTLVSCELDQFPETSLSTEQLWTDVTDADKFDVGLLACLRSVSTGGYGVLADVQSDLFNLTSKSTAYFQVTSWQFTTAQFEGDGLWSGNYNMIANANNIINNIDCLNSKVEEGSAEAAALKKYKANAYFARAYGYANMVTRYCKNYDAATADATPGLSLVYEVNVLEKPARATLAKTYEQILNDLKEAETCFGENADVMVDRPSIHTVHALRARVYLQMKRYQDAIDEAKKVMAVFPLIDNADDFANMWYMDEGSEIIYQPTFTPDERTGTYGAFIGYDIVNDCYSCSYLPTQGLLDLYEADDYRYSAYFIPATVSSGVQVTDATAVGKFPGNPALLKQGDVEGQTFYNMTKAFRVAEMYLIAAEAQYNLNQTEGGFLNTLRQKRGASAIKATGEALFQEIKNEWAREMCGEGFRLDCLKRWGDGFTRMPAQQLEDGFLNTQPGFQNLTVTADNFRFIWEIPSQDLQANKNLERNWPKN